MDKVCVFCGESCDGQPRGKDPKGRYYHIACRESAMQARAAPSDEPDMMAEIIDASAPAAAPTVPCPGCAAPMAAGAAICTQCGYSPATGHQASVQVMQAPSGGGRPVWPVIIGPISIFVAVCGMAAIAIDAMGGFVGGAGGSHSVGVLFGLALRGILTLYLLFGGVYMTTRNQRCATTLRQWAMAKIALTVVCGGIGLIALGVASSSAAKDMGIDTAGVPMGAFMAVLAALMLLSLVWPVFILIWLGRSKVQQEIGTW